MALGNNAAPAVAVAVSNKHAESERKAAAVLARSLIENAEEAVRQDGLREFHAANHSKARVFAYAALKDRCEAEDAVAQTYVELLEGRTRPEFFFRALKSNISDRQRGLARERAMFEPADEVLAPVNLAGEDDDDESALEPASSGDADQDPLDILIRREEAAGRERRLRQARRIARTDWRFRWLKQKSWARKFVGGTGPGT